MNLSRTHTLGVVFISALLGLGCAKSPDRPTVYPVSGKLLVNGNPAIRAEVVLVPLNVSASQGPAWKQLRPTAIVEADGSFRPTTFSQHDGAPAGQYAVIVTWPSIASDQGEEITGPDRLQGRYSKPEHPATKFTVQAGNNEIPPIHLK
jgi:hypothetical protein